MKRIKDRIKKSDIHSFRRHLKKRAPLIWSAGALTRMAPSQKQAPGEFKSVRAKAEKSPYTLPTPRNTTRLLPETVGISKAYARLYAKRMPF